MKKLLVLVAAISCAAIASAPDKCGCNKPRPNANPVPANTVPRENPKPAPKKVACAPAPAECPEKKDCDAKA